MRRLVHRTLWCIAGSFGILGLLQWYAIEQHLLMLWFNLFTPWTLAALIPAALLAIRLHQYRQLICFLIPIAYIVVCNTPNFLPKLIAFGPGEQISVMSFNVWYKNMDM